jgi:putative acetyltransferase
MDYVIREATPDDAEQLIERMQRLVEEPGINFIMGPGEFTFTAEEERRFLAERAESDNSVFLLALAGDRIIGNLGCDGGKRRAVRHEATIGISVDRDWRNRGVGTALMRRAIEWARGTGVLTRLQLQVFARNAPAIHLYQKLGFQIEGSRRNAILRDGEYIDSLMMALLL